MSDLVKRAMAFAEKAHEGQTRAYSKAPYWTHPKRVGDRAANILLQDWAVAAAYLHDVIEDCGVTHETLQHKFGADVANTVLDLTNQKRSGTREDRKHEDRRRLARCYSEAKTIKLIDRIDNLTELRDDAKRSAKARKFVPTYVRESVLLLTAIGDANEALTLEMFDLLAQMATVS